MTDLARVPETVLEKADEIGEERGMTIGEAIRHMCRNGEWDV